MAIARAKRIYSVEGDFGFIEVLTDGRRKYVQGRIRLDGEDVVLRVIPRDDQARPSVQQDLGKLPNLLDKLGIKSRAESVSRNSFHKRKVFLCPHCDYKNVRLTDVLVHMVRIHGWPARGRNVNL